MFFSCCLILLIVVVENIANHFAELVPLDLLVVPKIASNLRNKLENGLDSSIMVAFIRIGIESEHMLYSFFFPAILKEVPVMWGSNRVHESPLLKMLHGFRFILLLASLKLVLLFRDAFLMVIIDQLSYLVWLFFAKSFQENEVLDILKNVVVDMLEGFGAVEPLLLVLFIEVALPDP